MSDPLHPFPQAPPDGQPVVVKRSPWLKITKSQIQVWTPVVVALVADRVMTHDSAIAVVLAGGAALATGVWAIVSWLSSHTALRYLATVVPDDLAVVKE